MRFTFFGVTVVRSFFKKKYKIQKQEKKCQNSFKLPIQDINVIS